MELLEQVVMALIIKHTFFGTLLMRQSLHDDLPAGTACTDGKSIRVHMAWFKALVAHHRMFVFAHEILHSAFCHHLRRGSRIPDLWNAACDYVINLLLVDAGLITYEECNRLYLCDSKYAGLSEEQVYNILKQEQDGRQPPPDCPINPKPADDGQDGTDKGQKGTDKGQTPDGEGNPTDGEGKPTDGKGDVADNDGKGAGKSAGEVEDGKAAGDEAATKSEQAEWTVRMEQAARAAEKRGQCPGWAKEMIEAAKQAQLDWREVLWDFMLQHGAGSDDCTFSRINNRTRHLESKLGGRLPKMVGIDAEAICIGIDTSGSVPSWALAEFAAEIADIREVLDCTIHLVQCDTRINDTQITESRDEQFVIEYKGRGGTEFEPVFQYAANVPDCQALVYLTDLECTLPAEPSYPVLWITPWKVGKVEYGTVVTMGGKESRRG